jgi:FMN phosphatase YigB (HAD superfamily)
MGRRFIDDYRAIVLDMGNTFMFGADRFGDGEDYHATYRQLGGAALGPDELRAAITDVLDRMIRAFSDPARYDDFGSIHRFLADAGVPDRHPPEEVDLIVEVFGRHELGTVSPAYADVLHQLRRTHPLGIVSDVWAPSRFFEAELTRAGVRDLFTVRAWSSDGLSVKPSPRLFRKALDALGVAPAGAVYVGDSLRRDVAGAKAVGMAAVWIENAARTLTADIPQPDLIIHDLAELPTAPRPDRSG